MSPPRGQSLFFPEADFGLMTGDASGGELMLCTGRCVFR